MENFLAAFKQPSQPKKLKQTKKHIPWVEKYRPKTVEDVAHQEEVVAVLKKCLQGNDFPNLLFYGPPGTGKTSTILAAANELFGPELYSDRVLELNASDERGIQIIRDKVKKFSQLTAAGKRSDGKPCPPYKIVILDEADSMTSPAQSALRRTMEKQSRTTRFCLICNYVTRIIDPITSRCAKFRFKPLDGDISVQRLQHIANLEKVNVSDEVIKLLIDISHGDLRKAITLLQSVSHYGKVSESNSVTCQDVEEIAGVIPAPIFDKLVLSLKSLSLDTIQKEVKELLLNGYSGYQMLIQLHDYVLKWDLQESKKAIILEKLAIADHCLLDGADEYLQMLSLCSTIIQQLTS